MSLTDAQKINYERDGFLIYGSILLEEELEGLRQRIDALASGGQCNAEKTGIRLEAAVQMGELQDIPRRDKVWQILDPHLHDDMIFKHANNPKILDIVAQLIGTEDIKLFHTQTLMKPAFHGSIVSWHQDSAYWKSVSPSAMVSCWTALDDATEENGSVRKLTSSDKKGLWPHDRKDFLHAQGVDVSKATSVVLEAGGCSFHHSLTVHGSFENKTPHRRRGLETSYMRSDSQWLGDIENKPNFPLLRGREYTDCV